ncbi:MAG: hypothetical protein OEQ74_09905, partial [Gammaproteobacteria bacterium]|nr:hypothetical protein [Gammaproteobacteria bacterium]
MSLLSPKVCPVFIALALLYMAPASAAELSALLRIDTEIYYDSNIVMGSIEEKEAEAMRFSPLLNLRAKGTTWETNLNTMLRFTKLSEDQFDSDDQFVDTRLKKFGEKQAW